MSKQQNVYYLSDYQSPHYLVDTLDLVFDIFSSHTDVIAKMHIRRNYIGTENHPLVLDGEQLELLSLELNNQALNASDYQLTAEKLIISAVPAQFYLTIKTRIYPEKNKALNGLYFSSKIYCTQCEPHGFRRITYYIDRPDVLAIFTTTIIADADKCPVLLSNGNLMEEGSLENRRHWAKWHDPFKKPSYLFALVAGNLACSTASYTTISGKEVALKLYTEYENRNKCEFALKSLQRAMWWDEAAFGLEYDLAIYMIVAVNDFNMGAMENKGLNIFNSKYVLANPAIATDHDYQDIEKVIGHEYFHNWTGNRVTVRDWFQLCLKEGLTVFRDQEFSAYQWSAAVKRIEEVQIMRGGQFKEDSGPLAHPIRPQSYIQMSNFYTLTVYHKGAEVIRMIYRLLGAHGFRLGMDLYFSRFDGHAVTTDDFIQAFSDANHFNLTQFKRWYDQAGTPELNVTWKYDKKHQTFTLNVEQSCPSTPNQEEKLPFHLPLSIALFDEKGKEISALLIAGDRAPNASQFVLNITQAQQQFQFGQVKSEPIPSLLRDFSAPVRLKAQYKESDLLHLFAHDNDPVARWDAGQQVFFIEIEKMLTAYKNKQKITLSQSLKDILHKTLTTAHDDLGYIAMLIQIPDQNMIAERQKYVDVEAIYHVYREFALQIATELQDVLLSSYRACHNHMAYHINPSFVAKRSLKNTCLRYIARLNTPEVHQLIKQQYYHADNMTDRFAALQAVNHLDCTLRDELFADFAIAWKHEPLVLDKWFALQAASELPDTALKVMELLGHPDFLLENPNKLYALLGTFSNQNPYHFHTVSGIGYKLLADEILRIQQFNPQVAARLANAFASWRKYNDERQNLLQGELTRILEHQGLSSELHEIISKILV